jgi:hypothetical protein
MYLDNIFKKIKKIKIKKKLKKKCVSKHTLLGIPVPRLDALGGIEVNGNGFDQSCIF